MYGHSIPGVHERTQRFKKNIIPFNAIINLNERTVIKVGKYELIFENSKDQMSTLDFESLHTCSVLSYSDISMNDNKWCPGGVMYSIILGNMSRRVVI